jgi:hypothetical protein
MASSISSSSAVHEAGHQAMPSGLRLTAADRPGMAQPVPERDIPDQPWRAISLTVLALVLIFTALWEWQMRRLELIRGDLSTSFYEVWASQRRQVDQHNVPFALIGDSRILYDTDLDRVAQLTGERPIQLGIPGGTGLLILEDMADDPHFKGLAIVGMSEASYFETRFTGIRTKAALDLSKWQSPSKWASFQVQRVLSKGLAMLDDSYQLSTLITNLDPDWRPGVRGPYHDVWKVGETDAEGQSFLWRRLDHDQRLSDHARSVWHQFASPVPLDDKGIQAVLVRSKIAIDKIRARGGDVVFLRPPSAPDLRQVEESHIARQRGWNALLAYTHTSGVHADDLPTVQHLTLPESSHLTHACATVFTDAYIRSVTALTPKLSLRPDAPPALSTRDCVAP